MGNMNFIKNNKKLVILILCFVIGVVLLLFGSKDKTKNGNTEVSADKNSEIHYSELIEKKLETFLKTVDGIESVKVFVTVDGGTELEYAGIGKGNEYASSYLVIDKGNEEEAAVVREIYPSIRGVAISCTGGNDGTVKKEITALIGAALGISTNKIMVTGYR